MTEGDGHDREAREGQGGAGRTGRRGKDREAQEGQHALKTTSHNKNEKARLSFCHSRHCLSGIQPFAFPPSATILLVDSR